MLSITRKRTIQSCTYGFFRNRLLCCELSQYNFIVGMTIGFIICFARIYWLWLFNAIPHINMDLVPELVTMYSPHYYFVRIIITCILYIIFNFASFAFIVMIAMLGAAIIAIVLFLPITIIKCFLERIGVNTFVRRFMLRRYPDMSTDDVDMADVIIGIGDI